MRTNVYVDGFNLYYGALKGTPFKWLDLRLLAESFFPVDEILRICYCTALLETHDGDGGPRQRQATYLSALQTVPGLDIVTGTFRFRTKRRPLAQPILGAPSVVSIFEWEEKKTDVNLATEMIFDCFSGTCDRIALVSNDTDLVRSIQRIRDELNVEVVVINPYRVVRTPREMYRAASRVLRVTGSHLRRSQFPDTVVDAKGRQIRKPANW